MYKQKKLCIVLFFLFPLYNAFFFLVSTLAALKSGTKQKSIQDRIPNFCGSLQDSDICTIMQRCTSYQPFSCTNCTILEGNIQHIEDGYSLHCFFPGILRACHATWHGTPQRSASSPGMAMPVGPFPDFIVAKGTSEMSHDAIMMPYGTSKCLISLGETCPIPIGLVFSVGFL